MKSKQTKGFSMIEILMVIGIVALFALLVFTSYHNHYAKKLLFFTAQSIRSDLEFTVQHAKTVGISSNIQIPALPGIFEIVDPKGIVKSTKLPPHVNVAVSGFNNNSSANAASVAATPSGFWLGFLPSGKTATNLPALLIAATETTWYMIAVNENGIVYGPSHNRSDIGLSDTQISSLLAGTTTITINGSSSSGTSTITVPNIPPSLASQIKTAWHL